MKWENIYLNKTNIIELFRSSNQRRQIYRKSKKEFPLHEILKQSHSSAFEKCKEPEEIEFDAKACNITEKESEDY